MLEEEQINEEEQNIINEPICNCNDVYKIGVCPVHFKEKKIIHDTIVTDENMVTGEVRQWVGLTFNCPKCGEDSIMDFFNYCGNCGTKIKLQSKRLTDIINEISKE